MFHRRGAHVLVDGQYGSTGKGLLAAYIAEKHGNELDVCVTNAGPNSGHTFYAGDRKVVLKQLPSLPVYRKLMHGNYMPVYISAGAIVDPDLLNKEVAEYDIPVFLSEGAAIIRAEDKEAELTGSVAAVAGTRQGVGVALANKVLRKMGATVGTSPDITWDKNVRIIPNTPDWRQVRIFVEVSQGFSLGLNSQFYPKVTSRECTVQQALADARIPAQFIASASMVIRTYPIRVGNVDGFSSGEWYPDQEETTWQNVGVTEERTTVTQRIRRVSTFSDSQLREALLCNRPRLLLVNFMNYLPKAQRAPFAQRICRISMATLGYLPTMLYGHGPLVSDISSNPESV